MSSDDVACRVKEASAQHEMDVSNNSVFTSLSFNLLILATLAIALGLILYNKRLRRYLAPRLDEDEDFSVFGGWIWDAWRCRHELFDAKIWHERPPTETTDLDGAVMVRFCMFGFKYSACGAVMSCVLMPAYASGGRDAVGFDRYNLSHLDENEPDWKYVLVVVAAYLQVFFFLHHAAHEWRLFTRIRATHFSRLARGLGNPDFGSSQAMRSIIVELVDEDSRSQDGLGVLKFFDQVFPGGKRLHSCVLSADTRLCHKDPGAFIRSTGKEGLARLKAGLHLQRHVTHSHIESSAPQVHNTGAHHFAGLLQGFRDARATVAEELREAWEAIEDVTVGVEGTDTAFVTFWNVNDRVVAEQLVLSHSGNWRARAASEVRDMEWQNVPVSYKTIRVRKLIAKVVTIGGLVFWSMPVAAIQVWTNLEGESPEWATTGYGALFWRLLKKNLPVMSLIALQYVLPEFLKILSKRFEHLKSKSEIDATVLARNIRFQFATLWVTVVSSTGVKIHEQFNCVVQRPEFLLNILRIEVPRVAVFFTTFLAARVGLSIPGLLFRGLFYNLPPGKKVYPAYPDYPRESTSLVLALVLGVTYSVLAPAVMPICAIFFGMALLAYCWLFRHVYTSQYDLGGACWEQMFNASCVGLLLGTMTLGALFLNMKLYSCSWCMAVLGLIVLGGFFYMQKTYAIPGQYLSLEEACDMDRNSSPEVMQAMKADYYFDPILTKAEAVVAHENDVIPDRAEASPVSTVVEVSQQSTDDRAAPAQPSASTPAITEMPSNGGSFQCAWPCAA